MAEIPEAHQPGNELLVRAARASRDSTGESGGIHFFSGGFMSKYYPVKRADTSTNFGFIIHGPFQSLQSFFQALADQVQTALLRRRERGERGIVEGAAEPALSGLLLAHGPPHRVKVP